MSYRDDDGRQAGKAALGKETDKGAMAYRKSLDRPAGPCDWQLNTELTMQRVFFSPQLDVFEGWSGVGRRGG